MKTLAIAVILAAYSLLAIPVGHAQAQKSSRAPTATEAKIDSTNDAKLQALQAEVQVMKEFTQHILSTVYFSLGTVVVVLIAMLGFGWYQNFRVFERDKEAMRQSLVDNLREETRKGFDALDNKATERFKNFDGRIARALEQTNSRISNLHLALEGAIFQANHASKTPETDFFIFCQLIGDHIDRVSPDILHNALSIVLDHVQTSPRIGSTTVTTLLALAEKTAQRHAVFGERLRELLKDKKVV